LLGIDTNILSRWLIDESVWPPDNPAQWAAVQRLLGDPNQRFHVNLIVLAEALRVIEKRLKQPASAVVDLLVRLNAAANMTLQDSEAVRAASAAHSRNRPGVNDRLIAEVNKRAGCEATLTFDEVASRTPGFRLLQSSG
jgi:predicted nucleic acid-binding protein